ncbi:DUF397 domain-containing protein [Actinoallomurus sp. NPDC052274]
MGIPLLTPDSWRKSTRSGGNEGGCVQVAVAGVSMERGERKAR